MPGTTDTVKAMLTPGEFVIRKEAVDMIGVPILEKLNDMPEAGGHSEIDRLIAMATLKNMTGMYGGGMVNAKQYMGGGKVDMYGHGGKVKNQMMMGYEHGGEAHGNLKPVPDDNPGLAKLPEAVRNKMGYMQEGGSVLNMALRRAEPVNFLEQLSYYEPPMAGEMGSQPKRNFFGELEEGQVFGKDILRPHEEKYLNHYNAESMRAKTNLIGFLPEDRELMFEFLNRSGVYDTPGEESVFKNNPNFKVPENEKRLARKLIRFEEKIDKRRNDLEKRIRIDSASKIPSQLDKYPRNLLSEEERKELFEIREQIQNSKSYQAMEDDQSRLYGNRQRREIQKELGLEPKEEYKSLFGFDPNRDRTSLGEDPREYEGEAPNMYDLLERDRKNFYSQYQKPRTGLLNLLGFMKGGMAYIDPVDSSIVVMSPEQSKMADEIINNIKFPAKTSRKYRLETLIDILNNPDLYGMNKKDSSLLDSSVKNMELEFYKDILESPKVELKEGSLMGMMKGGMAKKKKKYGYQEGGAVQDDAMMQNYLMNRSGMEFRKSQAEQANPFVPFDQRPPSSGEMMSPIPSGMEQGDMMRIIRDEREVLDMQDVELLRQKAQNALTRFQLDSLMKKATLDSLINQGSGDAMKIKRSPNDPFSFPNTPAQENFMQKYKEEMIDPTYFPEGS